MLFWVFGGGCCLLVGLLVGLGVGGWSLLVCVDLSGAGSRGLWWFLCFVFVICGCVSGLFR